MMIYIQLLKSSGALPSYRPLKSELLANLFLACSLGPKTAIDYYNARQTASELAHLVHQSTG